MNDQINRDSPGGPVVKNPPFKGVDTGSSPGQGTKIPHALGQLSPCTATKYWTQPKISQSVSEIDTKYSYLVVQSTPLW